METCLNPYTVSVLQNKNVKIFLLPVIYEQEIMECRIRRTESISHLSSIGHQTV